MNKENQELNENIERALGKVPCASWKIYQYDERRNIHMYRKDGACNHKEGTCYPKGDPSRFTEDVGLSSVLFHDLVRQYNKPGTWVVTVPSGSECAVLYETPVVSAIYGSGSTLPLALARAILSILTEEADGTN